LKLRLLFLEPRHVLPSKPLPVLSLLERHFSPFM
jgi:hypothetical protein